jgi:hypothetical protein
MEAIIRCGKPVNDYFSDAQRRDATLKEYRAALFKKLAE